MSLPQGRLSVHISFWLQTEQINSVPHRCKDFSDVRAQLSQREYRNDQ